jgi:hypothetical protein
MRGKSTEKMNPTAPRSVAEVLCDHVVLELERIDRMQLNGGAPSMR